MISSHSLGWVCVHNPITSQPLIWCAFMMHIYSQIHIHSHYGFQHVSEEEMKRESLTTTRSVRFCSFSINLETESLQLDNSVWTMCVCVRSWCESSRGKKKNTLDSMCKVCNTLTYGGIRVVVGEVLCSSWSTVSVLVQSSHDTLPD